MKTILWSSAIALLLSVSFTFATATTTKVVSLNSTEEFDEIINSHDLVLMKLYAPWCPHSKAMKSEYETAADILDTNNITLAELDCTAHTTVCTKYSVKGYPTLQLFRKGAPTDIYSGERKANSIAKYMRKHLSPGLEELSTESDLDRLKKDESIIAVAYISSKDQPTLTTWRSLSDKLRDDFAFGVVTDVQLATTQNVSHIPSVVLYKSFDTGRDETVITGSTNLEDFIKLNSVPLLDTITPDTFMDYVDTGRPLAYIFSDSSNTKQDMQQLFFPLAQKYRGKFNFVHISAVDYATQAEFLTLDTKANTWPALGVHDFIKGAKYPFDQGKDMTREAVEAFLDGIDQGHIEPSIKSQSLASVDEKENAVKVVVGNEFEKIVLDSTKDVLIEVYAPWCGHCRALEPTYQKLGEVMQAYDADTKHDIVIAKMDGTVNDVPAAAGFQVQGYPTIKFFQAKSNKMVDYYGSRSLKDFTKFLMEQNTKKTLNVDLDRLPEKEDETMMKDKDGKAVVVKMKNVGEEKHDEL